MSAVIYAITNQRSGRRYVGSSRRDVARRFSEHRSRLVRGAHINAKLQAAWNKHGADAFAFEVIASVLRVDDIEAVEQIFLEEAVTHGYNLAPTAGNTAGWRASPETRKRMSDAAKRRDHSVQIAAMAAASRGKPRPQHVLDIMQRHRTGRKISEETRAKMAMSATMRSRYSTDDRLGMAAMRRDGKTWKAIGAAYGTTQTAVIAYVRNLGSRL